MSGPVKPALTAEEWVGYRGRSLIVHGGVYSVEQETAHRNAAVCLKDQPFGFTRERLAAHEEVIAWAEAFYRRHFPQSEEAGGKLADAKADLARIEALLPPEEAAP